MKKFSFKYDLLKPIILLTKLLVVILFIIFFFSQSLLAQCDLNKIKDDFSSSQAISSKEVNLASVFPLIGNKQPWTIKMNFTIINNECIIEVTHVSQSYSDDFSSLEFKFKDGVVITLDDPLSSNDYSSGGRNEYTISYFPVSQENLIKFSQTDLSKFRAVFTYFPDYPIVEEDLKSKSIAQIRKDAGCILSEINLNTEKPKDESPGKCKYSKDENDDFTKIRTVFTIPEKIYDVKLNTEITTMMDVCGSNINGANGLQLNRYIIIKGFETVDIEQLKSLINFDQVDLLLENEEIINLKETETSKFINYGSNLYFSYKNYTIDNDSIWKKLQTVPPKKLKISINGTHLVTHEIEKKYNTSFIKAINCIDNLNISKSK